MLRRITLIFLTLFLSWVLVCLGCWGYIYTHQDQIATVLSSQLSKQLNTPIRIQNPALGFHPTPTLVIENIQINVADKNLQISIKKLHVGFSWQKILAGQFQVAHLDMIQPEIDWTMTLTAEQSVDQMTPLTTFNSLGSTLDQARITDGSLRLQIIPHASVDQRAQIWHFQHLNVTANNSVLAKDREVTLKGQMIQKNREPAPFSVQGQIPRVTAQWSDTPIQLRGSIQNLHSSQLGDHSPYHASGPVNIQLNLKGQFSSGMSVHTAILPTTKQPLFIVGANIKQPLRSLTVNTTVRRDNSRLLFSDLNINYNQLAVAGSLSLTDWQTHPRLQASLHSDDIPVQQAQLWLPKSLVQQIPSPLQQATVRCQKLIVDGPLAALKPEHILAGKISIHQPEFSLNQIRGRNVTATILWQNNQFELSTSPVTIDHNTLSLQGPIHVKIAQQPNNIWLVTSNLNPWSMDLAGALKKTTQQPASVTFQVHPATSTDHSWHIDSGELQLPGYRILFSANYSSSDRFQVDLNLPHYQLETISHEIPILNWMELKGMVSARYRLNKHPGQTVTGSGQIQLTDCAISPTFVIAPIHHINGTVTVNDFSAQATELALVLGSSAMTASATIKDLRHPVAEIHAQGDGVIARDLVFNSDKMRLNNLNGRIAIHAQGIDFIDASVDLEQGTHATVNGKLVFKGPLLELDIAAPFANIDEIIALWSDQQAKPDKHYDELAQDETAQQDEFINIRAQVERGVISGFEFQQARGRIHYKTNQLRIEPLSFAADKGTGSGAITVTHKPNTDSSLLKIEAKLFDINADKVYQQLLRHIGLVTGTLTGNFSIQGPIGANFLENSQGHFHLDITHGVLRQFKTLSKAFSILNVAQLFSLNLPDMDREGMPFSSLTADINLDRGVLHSENLVINSNSMGVSVIGEHNLNNQNVDLVMAIKPLGTLDTVVKHLPIAGWILAGEEQAIITTHFKVSGSSSDPTVEMLPLNSISTKVFNIFKRTLKLPGTLITDPKKILINPKD